MKIVKATYGPKDVLEKVIPYFNNERIALLVSNHIFGDTNPGSLKKLTIEFENGESAESYENNYLIYPKMNKEKLGIFYTNNNNSLIDNTINCSLQTIQKSSYGIADIVTCVWEKIPNNPFIEILSQTKISNHLNQVLQILQTLYFSRKENKNYKYVSFLEHDCLYPNGYFDYDDFSGNCICNMNYIGLSKDGWQDKTRNDKPLSQITMEFNYAIKHFESILPNALIINDGLSEPPHDNNNIKEWNCINPSVHVNHGYHFTSHYKTYSEQKKQRNDHWKNYELYSNLFVN